MEEQVKHDDEEFVLTDPVIQRGGLAGTNSRGSWKIGPLRAQWLVGDVRDCADVKHWSPVWCRFPSLHVNLDFRVMRWCGAVCSTE